MDIFPEHEIEEPDDKRRPSPEYTPHKFPDGWAHVQAFKLSINPMYNERFDAVGEFVRNRAIVMKDGKHFHIRRDGKPAYEARYLEVEDFWGSLAVVQSEEGFFHIRRDGTPAYSQRFKEAYDFFKGAAVVCDQQGKCFHIGPDGAALYTERYDFVEPFHPEGYAWVEIGEGPERQRFKIDKTGKRVA